MPLLFTSWWRLYVYLNRLLNIDFFYWYYHTLTPKTSNFCRAYIQGMFLFSAFCVTKNYVVSFQVIKKAAQISIFSAQFLYIVYVLKYLPQQLKESLKEHKDTEHYFYVLTLYYQEWKLTEHKKKEKMKDSSICI